MYKCGTRHCSAERVNLHKGDAGAVYRSIMCWRTKDRRISSGSCTMTLVSAFGRRIRIEIVSSSKPGKAAGGRRPARRSLCLEACVAWVVAWVLLYSAVAWPWLPRPDDASGPHKARDYVARVAGALPPSCFGETATDQSPPPQAVSAAGGEVGIGGSQTADDRAHPPGTPFVVQMMASPDQAPCSWRQHVRYHTLLAIPLFSLDVGLIQKLALFVFILGLLGNHRIVRQDPPMRDGSPLPDESDETHSPTTERFWKSEYFCWLLPTIGFIGTIFGIGLALIRAKLIFGVGGDAEQTQHFSEVVEALGIAFDTTLFSLILTAILMYQQRHYEQQLNGQRGEPGSGGLGRQSRVTADG